MVEAYLGFCKLHVHAHALVVGYRSVATSLHVGSLKSACLSGFLNDSQSLHVDANRYLNCLEW